MLRYLLTVGVAATLIMGGGNTASAQAGSVPTAPSHYELMYTSPAPNAKTAPAVLEVGEQDGQVYLREHGGGTPEFNFRFDGKRTYTYMPKENYGYIYDGLDLMAIPVWIPMPFNYHAVAWILPPKPFPEDVKRGCAQRNLPLPNAIVSLDMNPRKPFLGLGTLVRSASNPKLIQHFSFGYPWSPLLVADYNYDQKSEYSFAPSSFSIQRYTQVKKAFVLLYSRVYTLVPPTKKPVNTTELFHQKIPAGTLLTYRGAKGEVGIAFKSLDLVDQQIDEQIRRRRDFHGSLGSQKAPVRPVVPLILSAVFGISAFVLLVLRQFASKRGNKPGT